MPAQLRFRLSTCSLRDLPTPLGIRLKPDWPAADCVLARVGLQVPMNFIRSIAGHDHLGNAAVLKAAIIYDRLQIALTAAARLIRVSGAGEHQVTWSFIPLRSELLHQEEVAKAALNEARDAELILIALSRDLCLTVRLVAWLEKWAARRQCDHAAVAVLVEEAWRGIPQSVQQVRELAWRSGLHCFWENPGAERISRAIAHDSGWEVLSRIGEMEAGRLMAQSKA